MSKSKSKLSKSIIIALVVQAVILLLSYFLLEGREVLQICIFTAVAFWIVALFIVLRRQSKLTNVDHLLIRWGYLPLCVIAGCVMHLVWYLQEY